MRSFQEQAGEFEKRGIRLAAVSTDPPETNQKHRQKLGITFPLLSDATGETLRRYDLLHPGAGPGGSDIARPAEILIDANGVIRWMNLTESATVRVEPETVLAAWDGLEGSGPGTK